MDHLGDKLRSLRKQRNLSLQELAKLADCPPSYLSMIENNKVDPSISRLKKIAEGLGITIIDLFREDTYNGFILRKQNRVRVPLPKSKTELEILAPDLPDKQIDARLAIVHPGGGSEGYYDHQGEEFGLVLEGSLELVINGKAHQLKQGDSFYFRSEIKHRFKNKGRQDAIVLWVNHPPSF